MGLSLQKVFLVMKKDHRLWHMIFETRNIVATLNSQVNVMQPKSGLCYYLGNLSKYTATRFFAYSTSVLVK